MTTLKLLRILVEVDKIWIIDLGPNVTPLWNLWVVRKKLLYELPRSGHGFLCIVC